jgi:hypothetical protein
MNVFLLEIDRLKVRMPRANSKGNLELTEEFEPMDKLEIVGVFASESEARAAIPTPETEALITKLPIGRTYLRGIGEAVHKHLNAKEY